MSRRESGNRFVFETKTDSFVLQTDIQRLQQVLINLLTNAAKFTKNGTITLQFEVEKEKNRVLFAVADTGCGIPKEKQKQVFERFEKLNEYAQGTGLGLSICKLTVDKWGGDIWIDPDYEDGAEICGFAPVIRKRDYHRVTQSLIEFIPYLNSPGETQCYLVVNQI